MNDLLTIGFIIILTKVLFQVRLTGCKARAMFTYTTNKAPNWRKKCEDIFFSKFKGNVHTRFGVAKEKVAKKIMKMEYGQEMVLANTGFVISIQYPWLGCSPDAILIEDDESVLIECKSLKVGQTYEGLQFLQKCTCLMEGPVGHFSLRKNTTYYTQIQLGLFVCNLSRAKLLLYNHKGKKNVFIDVNRDIAHIRELVYNLTNTYFVHCLKYLCDNEDKLYKMLS